MTAARWRAALAALFLPAAAAGPFLATAGEAYGAPGVTVAFVGDIMLDGLPGKAISQGRDPFAPFAPVLDAADLRVGNLECVVAAGGHAVDKIYAFRADPRTLGVLKRHFDAVSLANNHSGDFGRAAFGEMLGLLEREGIPYFGGGRNLRQAHAPLIVERHGLKIALLGYDEFLPRRFEADYDAPGVAWSEDEQVLADIATARRVYHADVVIPVMHWGWEYERQGDTRQHRLAHAMIEAGADAVVGGHPHVTQEIEIYRGKPIVYSLGNFLFDGFHDEATNTGWALLLELDGQGVRGFKTRVARLDGEGFPHPADEAKGACWSRGQSKPREC